jgi:hypothetical protein
VPFGEPVRYRIPHHELVAAAAAGAGEGALNAWVAPWDGAEQARHR